MLKEKIISKSVAKRLHVQKTGRMPQAKPRKRKAKSLSQLKKQAWCLLSQIVRRSRLNIYDQAYCYTCEEWKPWQELQAGHAIGGRHNAVLFDEEILRPQCMAC